MTDQFKDKNEPDAKTVRSFKEQILAELEEAHRLRRLREDELLISDHNDQSGQVTSSEEVVVPSNARESANSEQVWEADSDFDSVASNAQKELETSEVNSQSESTKASANSLLSVSSESYKSNIIPLNEEYADQRQPVEGQLSFDLDDTIPLMPISESEAEIDTVEEEVTRQDDLSVSRVMNGFQKLFDGSNQKNQAELESDNDEEQLALSSDDSDTLGSHLEDTQVYNSQAFLNEERSEEEVASFKRNQRQRTNRIASKISRGLFTILALVILATGFLVYRYVDSGIKPLDANAKDYIQVEIPSGSGNKLIGRILEENGVIKSGQIFNYYAKFKNYTDFKSGFYNFQKSMSLDEIVKKLQEGGTAVPERPALGKILIPEGYTLEQIAKAVALNANTADKKDKTPFSEADFMRLVQDEAFIARMVERFPGLLRSLPNAEAVKYQLEGYLYPATYSYYEETTLEDIVEQMLAAMDANLSPFYSTIANNGMTVNQILTLASLVEKEGATDDDRKLIAGVFYNRWNQGMPLQSNIAILYAMGKLGQSTTLLEDATIDTGIDSPYNIYINPGLMPGPVDSPSIAAIKAAINPEKSNYLYFVADVTTGAVYYAENYDEHSANVEKYINSQLAKNN